MPERNAPSGQEFVLKDGTRISSLDGLYQSVSNMTDEDFSHFVNPDKNDFASWIEYCLDDKFLASYVRRAKMKDKLLKVLFISLFR